MTELQNESTVAVVRDHNKVAQELKNAVSKLTRAEARATESDKLATTFNAEIMDMASGNKAQTASRTIQTIAAEQAKHIKRAIKVRETNAGLATEIRKLSTEYSDMIAELLTPYPVSEVEDSDTDVEESDEIEDDGEAGYEA